MHMNQLSYFLHVAETGSINAAAQNFFISQQAINTQIKKLEDELEVPLLNRTHTGITLTPQGQLFIPYAKMILQQYQNAKQELQKFQQQELQLAGNLSIFSASIFSDLFLPGAVSTFMQFHPNVAIKIIEAHSSELLSYLFHGYCDLVLYSAGVPYIQSALKQNESEDIKVLSLIEDSMVLCARPDHPLMKYKSVDNTILEKYAQKSQLHYSLYQITPIVMPDLIYAQAVSMSSNADLHKTLMLEGLSVTYMPKLAYIHKFQKDGFACIPMTTAYPIAHCLLYRDNPNNENNILLKRFLEFTQKQFQQKFGTHTEK